MPHPRYRFDPAEHEVGLTAILTAASAHPALDDEALQRLVRRHPKGDGRVFSKFELLRGLAHLGERLGLDRDRMQTRLRMKPMRTHSGVAPVTVLTAPFPCPGKCVFCPSDVRMPKSYLSREPGAQRAAWLRFDPYAQTRARLVQLAGNGHPVDKVELIVLGGTWSFYPEAYQVWFVTRCFEALNAFDPADLTLAAPEADAPDHRVLVGDVDGRAPAETYNQIVRRFPTQEALHPETPDWSRLERAHAVNEAAAARGVGLSLETRPDHLPEGEVVRLRRLGATKVQIGIQSLDDDVLRVNQRGHDVAATRAALRRLRAAGFKIQGHWMPNLLGSDPERDRRDFVRLFADPEIRPDELKVYPCALIESAELMQHHERGAWAPYADAALLDLLVHALAETPRYCRLTRVIRDIPGHDIVAGSTESNLRERAESTATARGHRRRDIRAREIRRDAFAPEALTLRETTYAAGAAEERFLEFVTPEDRLLAYLRLSLPTPDAPQPAAVRGAAIIREVHVYGAVTEIGRAHPERPQHLGLGRRLVERAVEIATASGYDRLAVISGVGTRGYYRKLGFVDGPLYQVRGLAAATAVHGASYVGRIETRDNRAGQVTPESGGRA